MCLICCSCLQAYEASDQDVESGMILCKVCKKEGKEMFSKGWHALQQHIQRAHKLDFKDDMKDPWEPLPADLPAQPGISKKTSKGLQGLPSRSPSSDRDFQADFQGTSMFSQQISQ